MKKFAMIPINRRYDEEDHRIVRRVLISYENKDDQGVYQNTKLIETDPYFKDPNASHRYIFTDHCFELIYDASGENYKLDMPQPYQYKRELFLDPAIEFEAASQPDAIDQFNNREEYH